MAAPVAPPTSSLPLCVDLDGTVIRSDMLWESLVRLLRRNPLYVFLVLAWWTKGRAYLKRQIAARVTVDVSNVPLCAEFCAFLKQERERGREVFLVTASDRELAEQISARLGLFSAVLASDGKTNLRGKAKATTLESRFGPHGFDYAGNSSVDLPVWRAAREAIVVNARSGVSNAARQQARVSAEFEPQRRFWLGLVRMLRPHQWVKNLIVFVPLLTAHKLAHSDLLSEASLAFIAFSFCASAVYMLNDLLDLDADRQHPTKQYRPLARGDVPLSVAVLGIPALLLLGFGVSAVLNWSFVAVLGTYLLLTSAYSWFLKQAVLLDVFCLAVLYTLRLIGGHEATAVKYSAWLLVFSMFIFLSLALVKRFVEVSGARSRNKTEVAGRGYGPGDMELLATLGTSSGYLAALVLALYVNSEDVLKLYSRPILLLLVCPLLLYWISRIWLLAHRGRMHDDPIVFALKDPVSYIVGLLTLLVLWVAAIH